MLRKPGREEEKRIESVSDQEVRLAIRYLDLKVSRPAKMLPFMVTLLIISAVVTLAYVWFHFRGL